MECVATIEPMTPKQDACNSIRWDVGFDVASFSAMANESATGLHGVFARLLALASDDQFGFHLVDAVGEERRVPMYFLAKALRIVHRGRLWIQKDSCPTVVASKMGISSASWSG